MATAPHLTTTTLGDVLELRPGGSWTAINVTALEALSDGVSTQLDGSKTVRLDMAEVRELDTRLQTAWVDSRDADTVGRVRQPPRSGVGFGMD